MPWSFLRAHCCSVCWQGFSVGTENTSWRSSSKPVFRELQSGQYKLKRPVPLPFKEIQELPSFHVCPCSIRANSQRQLQLLHAVHEVIQRGDVPVSSMLQAMTERVLLPLASHCSTKALSDFFVGNIFDMIAFLLNRFTKVCLLTVFCLRNYSKMIRNPMISCCSLVWKQESNLSLFPLDVVSFVRFS